MSDNVKVWNNYNVDEEDIKLIVEDVLAFKPVIILGRIRTGKSKFAKILQERLGEVLYIDERDKSVYEKYLSRTLNDDLELFTAICDKEYVATIVDGVHYIDNFDNIKSLFVNNAMGVICTAIRIDDMAKFGLDLSEFTIIRTDVVNGDFVYEIER